MNQKAPGYIETAGIIGAKITHKWNLEINADLYEQSNSKLQNAIQKTHFKGKMAIAVALTEWTVWRLNKLIDIQDALHRIEAAWASVIDPAYTREVEDMEKEDEGPVDGPLNLAIGILDESYGKYSKVIATVGESVTACALVARHVCPNKKAFDTWLSASLKRMSELFPMDLSHYNRAAKTYDNSYEQPMPREVFNPEFQYDEKQSTTLLNNFLQSLDLTRNPYLNSAEKMIAMGFKGTPYKL